MDTSHVFKTDGHPPYVCAEESEQLKSNFTFIVKSLMLLGITLY